MQAARTQARRRLVGALVLLLIGVVGFPLLFETQPRPLPADTPILVPEGTPARVAAPAPMPSRPAPVVPPDAGTEVAAAPASPVASAPTGASAPAPAASKAAAPAVVATAAPKPAAPASSKPAQPAEPASAAAAGRFVVQVGAYNDIERMKAARAKLEKMGLKSYTQDVDTPTGKRTRVRVGPFATRQEADSVAAKLKAAGMQAAILSL